MTAPDATPEDERVEAVARELWRIDSSEYSYDWEPNADTYRDEAREVLAAADATPRDARVKAEAWDEGYEAAHDRPFMPGDEEPNPYRR